MMHSEADILTKLPAVTHILQQMAERTIRRVVPLLLNFPQDESELTLENKEIEEIMACLDLLNSWISLHHNVLQRFETRRYYAFREFAQSQQYAMLFT